MATKISIKKYMLYIDLDFRFKEVTIECIQQIRDKNLFSILECLCLTVSPFTFSQ